MNVHQELVGLIIAYTLAGAFAFTVVVTCLSLVGWIKFADQKQQQRLFQVLIVEVAVICTGYFSGFLQYNPSSPVQRIGEDAIGNFQARREAAADLVKRLPPDQVKALARELGHQGGDPPLVYLLVEIANASSVAKFEPIAKRIQAITGKGV